MQKNTVAGTLLNAGCDWLTCTQVPGARHEMMWATASGVIAAEEMRGDTPRSWMWQGYVGEATRDFAYGRRADGIIVRMHGATAHRWWRRFARHARNISRFDVQVTVAIAPADFRLGSFHRDEAIAHRKLRGATATIASWDTHQGGYTLYLGRRTSDVLTRIYDKHHESPDLYPDAGVWRYEVEWKRERAFVAAKRILSSTTPEMMMLGMLAKHLEDRGLTPAFPALTRESVIAPRQRSDIDTRLRWLADSVRPAVDWLREHGQTDEVRRILGVRRDELRED